jgi:hypothetical protein
VKKSKQIGSRAWQFCNLLEHGGHGADSGSWVSSWPASGKPLCVDSGSTFSFEGTSLTRPCEGTETEDSRHGKCQTINHFKSLHGTGRGKAIMAQAERLVFHIIGHMEVHRP